MKRISALLLVLALVLSMSVPAFAAGADNRAVSLSADVSDVDGGQIVRVSMADGEGVTNGIICVSYDPELVKLTGWTVPEIYGAASVNDQAEGTVSLAWVGSDLTGENTELISLHFELLGSETPAYEIGVEEIYAGSWEVSAFVDIEGHWAKEEILAVYETGLVKGIGESTFNPNGATDRAMFVTVLYRLVGSPDVTGLSVDFTDVKPGRYYEDAVIWATNAGVVKGVSTTAFAPKKQLTREEMATMLYRFAALVGESVEVQGDLNDYTDAEDVSDFAYKAMVWATNEGIITGFKDGSLQPQGSATRAQLAAILCRFLGLDY